MHTYNYVSEQGTIFPITANFNWASLCHSEDVMDGWNMFMELGGFGWSVCRLCGRQAYFTKRWPK